MEILNNALILIFFLSFIGFAVHLIKHFNPQVDFNQMFELKVECEALTVKLEQKDKEIEMWKERGSRYSASRDAAEVRLKELQDLFARLQMKEHELETTKDMLDKVMNKNSESTSIINNN